MSTTHAAFAGAHRRPRRCARRAGSTLSCKGWQQEAALRMLMNNLDPDVAERPDDLVVYGGTGRAARSWEAFDAIVAPLRTLEHDETLLVQSGKPVAVFRTHAGAPRVLIANTNLVGRWATWDHFRELERAGLMMYGQMTAGSWIYIGSQGILQGTYETFGAVARTHFGGSLAGRFVLTAGLGGMGGAQPLAATMHGAAILGVEVDEARIDKRLATGYCDRKTAHARRGAGAGSTRRQAAGRAPVGGARRQRRRDPARARAARRHARRRHRPDERARHAQRLRTGRPSRSAEAPTLRAPRPGARTCARADGVDRRARARHAALQQRGAVTFDYGNNIRTVAFDAGVANAFDIPGFVPEYVRPLVLRREGPVPVGRAVRRPGRHRAAPTTSCSSCSRTTSTCAAGSRWPASACTSRDCRRASAGWGRASARASAWRSTTSWPAARSRRRSSSAATTSTPAASRRRSARPRR